MKLGEALYKQHAGADGAGPDAGGPGAAPGGGPGGHEGGAKKADENVVDADFEEVHDDKNKKSKSA